MLIGFTSRKAVIHGAVIGVSVILGNSIIENESIIDHLVYIGYPVRSKLLQAPKSIEELDELSSGSRIGSRCIIRSYSVIYEEAELSDGVEVGHGVMIRERYKVGAKSRIGSFTQLDGQVEVGANVNIQSRVYLPHLSVVEDDVFIGPGVVVTNDLYPVSNRLVGVRIRRGAIIGAGAVLMAGIEVGENAVVAAGSVVTRNVPPNSVVVGSPARVRMTREEYEEKKRAYEESN